VKIEIAIAGPNEALGPLCTMIESLGPTLEQGKGGKSRVLIFSDHKTLDDHLLVLSRVTTELEKKLQMGRKFDFQVRNLAYCEPPPFRDRTSYEAIPELTIQPCDSTVPRPEDPRNILLDAELAFGTGRHPTTLLCLKALARMARDWENFRNSSVLDFGCGTGLLAIAALRLGAVHAVGVEIDHDACEAARRNRALNALADRLEIVEGSWEEVREKYDLIFSNLVASLLLRTGRKIPDHLKEKGRVVISGFSAQQMKAMEDFFVPMGFEPLERDIESGWGCLVFTKPRPATAR
jgi:ribosomal protein L11 methyltransferase